MKKKLTNLAVVLVRQAAVLRRAWLPVMLSAAETLLVFASGMPVAWAVYCAWLGLDVAAALLAGSPGLPGLAARSILVWHAALGLLAGAALLGHVAGAVAGVTVSWVVAAAVVIAAASAFADWLHADCLR